MTEQLRLKIAGEVAMSENPGASMKKWRDIFGIAQVELSTHLKISPSTISDYESNRRASPGIAVIQRFVNALFEIDATKGGQVVKRFKESETPTDEYFEVQNFPKAITAKEFMKTIGGVALTGQDKLETTMVYGSTTIDAVRVILELPYDSFMKIYGTTSQRALLFTRVDTGRSSMVAVRMAPIKPALVVLHGLKETEVDKLGVKIAESEGIPLILVNSDLEDIKKKIKTLG